MAQVRSSVWDSDVGVVEKGVGIASVVIFLPRKAVLIYRLGFYYNHTYALSMVKLLPYQKDLRSYSAQVFLIS